MTTTLQDVLRLLDESTPGPWALSVEPEDSYGLFKADKNGSHYGQRFAQIKGKINAWAICDAINYLTENREELERLIAEGRLK